MALSFLNRCVWRAASSGTGDFVVASAITGYQVPADCLNPVMVDGATYRYFAQSDDLTQWEVGVGVWDVASSTLTRSAILDSSNSGSIVTFSAAPSVFMGGPLANDVAFRGSESRTTDSGSPIELNIDVMISYLTTDGTGSQQFVDLPYITPAQAGLLHLIILRTQVDPSDVVQLSISPESFNLTYEDAFVLVQWTGSSWIALSGDGEFAGDVTTFPRALMIGYTGERSFAPPNEIGYYATGEAVTMVAGAGNANAAVFVTFIFSDGSGGSQTITIGEPSAYGGEYNYGAFHIFRFSIATDPADEVVIAAGGGIVGSEVITLADEGAWAAFMYTSAGWLPWSFGDGATTSASGPRTLTLADTGELSWA